MFLALAKQASDSNAMVPANRRGENWWLCMGGPLPPGLRREKNTLRAVVKASFPAVARDDSVFLVLGAIWVF